MIIFLSVSGAKKNRHNQTHSICTLLVMYVLTFTVLTILCMYMYYLRFLYVVNVKCKQIVSRKPYTGWVSILKCIICL